MSPGPVLLRFQVSNGVHFYFKCKCLLLVRLCNTLHHDIMGTISKYKYKTLAEDCIGYNTPFVEYLWKDVL